MRVLATILGIAAAACLAVTPAVAGPGSTSQRGGGKPTATGKPATSGKPTTMTGKPTTMTGKPTTGGGQAARTTGKPTTTEKPTTTGKPTTSTSAAASAKTTKTKGKPTTATATTMTTTDTAKLNPIAAKIASKPNLSAKLTAMLPIDSTTGRTMTLDKASLGFKNQGQFIAALHVSQNLGIPFTELKSNMVTITPGLPGEQPTATQTGSLGQAIQKSKATADVSTEVQRAERQATVDVQATATVTTTQKGGVR
jgi:hypothetical protein